ncbi:MAG TPA: murein biosynthesis integral membrane protein MurJ [Solimonas sp.]|nr:murein biosynthesis integral membrane protein MurJ [Solimonas sp.]
MSASLLRSSGVVGLMTLLSRVLGFVRDMMFASAFGAGAGMDVFIVAQAIPNFGRRMFAEGAFQQAFVPVFTETRLGGAPGESRDLMAVTMGTLGGVLALITLVGCLGAPLLLLLFGSGFSAVPGKAELGAELLRWTFPYLMFISLASLAGSVLNSHGRFAVPAATPIILNVCLIGSAFIDDQSVHILAYAVFVAGILQFLVQLPSLARLGLLPRPRWGWRDARVRRVIRLMIPVALGSGVAQISLILNSNLATWLGNGRVSWLYYADRLMEFPLGIFSIAVGTVILPALSAQHSRKSPEEFSATLDWGLRIILVIGLPAALGLVLLAGPLIATIFGSGKFGPTEIRMTMYALWAYAAGFMGFSMIKVLVPGFYARQETRVPMRIGIVALVAGMALSVTLFALARWSGFAGAHAGLALSTSFTACLNAGLLLRRLRRDSVFVPQPGWGAFALRLLLANVALALVALALAGPLDTWLALGRWARWAQLLWVIAAAAAAYFATLWIAGLRPAHFRRH